ncbi:hypothetical protein CCZ37_16185 [Vibrio qinghaiensis]|uniref:Uncharacterized protein n=1 Tax=Vibrio qinghaiensis TaxID=2025808 RepID=A0A223N2M7_9VIBR|nr:hypothetical protein [Vibrio qinghaiensis]EGR5588453.1 hypothetical protein [Vibrio cholerae]ELA8177612.1 hypothetical protein [Vibrio alginolyticus]HDM8161951.1 hypothetical protein [Vibrio harveyi]ASU24075.1 hypothetical protein CCZ37_16185 [Vibrio qinghaiensis]ELM6610958.1 hypothetical protein [Vibrio cholerae]
MVKKEISDLEITDTQIVDDLMTGGDIGTWQADYLLREVEFERLKNGKPVTYNWANSIGLTTFGFALNLLGKGYSDYTIIVKGEWIALAFGGGATIVLYLVGLCLKDSRKLVMKKIEKHFESAPTRRRVLGGNNGQ